MAQAVFAGEVIAQSEHTIVVDGYTYFPRSAVNTGFLKDSEHTSYCGWKGTASYYHVAVGDELAVDAAWYYATPKDAALHVKGHIGFWKGVQVLP